MDDRWQISDNLKLVLTIFLQNDQFFKL